MLGVSPSGECLCGYTGIQVIQKTELMLPREFLSEIADTYGLSPEQTEVFLAKFGNDKSDQEIINAFHISDGTLRYRLGKIYKKFSIGGKGTGKAHQLLSFLTGEYQKDSALGSPSSHASADDLDALVQRVRSLRHEKIQYQCGTMRMLDIAQPVAIADIYTDVNVLEEITSQQWREISDLLQSFNPESDNFDRLGLGKRLKRVAGLKAVSRYSKLMVLGKPGSGKTTLLQWVAIKCDLGEFQLNRVPIFISLKNFADDTRRNDSEFRLLNYISEEFVSCGADKSVIETILTQGKALILLDGLDEVPEEDGDEVDRQIRRFVEKYFKNQFIITCRIAAQKYRFQGFTDVEVADFKSEQVEAFAKKLFLEVARNNREEGEATARQFIEKLNQPENQQIRELAVTPILLNLACLVFQEKGEFPSKRSKLYEQGLDILLVRWDESRGITREDAERNFYLEHKIELLSQIAAITFEKSHYFFEQSEVEQCIADYLRSLPNPKTDRATLQRDSKEILKSIEAQHGLFVERARGIYSFSHLTFQEYFTAKAIVTSWNTEVFPPLVSHVADTRWSEVFLLVAEMLQSADSLWRFKQQIDALLATDEKLQQFLIWLNEKSLAVSVPYKPVAVRAFYFTRVLNFTHALVHILDLICTRTHDIDLDTDLFHALDHALTHDLDYACVRDFVLDHACTLSRILALNPELEYSLQQLKSQLSNSYKDKDKFNDWWQANSRTWSEQLRTVMIKYRNIGYDWQFSKKQKELLKQYYDTNKFLVECLNSGCEVSPEVREIEDTLLLPLTEIENYSRN